MSCQAAVKSFNAKAGWGFISLDGEDVFLHVKDCGPTFRPKPGAEVSFDTEDSPKQPGQKVAKNVKALRNGACNGIVKSFVDKKGYGFIDYQGTDVFLHINDCVDGRPTEHDQVNFDVEDSDKNPGQKTAKRVVGCSRMLDQGDDKGKGKGGKDDGKGKGKGYDDGYGFDKGGYGKGYDKGGYGGGYDKGYDKGGYGYDKGGYGKGYDPYGGGYDKGGYGYDKGGYGKGYDPYGGGYDKGGYGYDKGGYGSPYGKGFDKGYDKGGYGYDKGGKGGYDKGGYDKGGKGKKQF